MKSYRWISEKFIFPNSQTLIPVRWMATGEIRNPTYQRPSKKKTEEMSIPGMKKKKTKMSVEPIALDNYPSIFTVQSLGSDYDISQHTGLKKSIFELMYTCYLPPEDFNFQLPSKNKCEIAFIGRSNVGKSSLIDNLLGNKKIVRVSKEAGCTTQINYFGFIKGYSPDFSPKERRKFDENEHLAYLVDMPGYGFAKRSKQMIKQWDLALEKYLMNRSQSTLRRVYILVDSRFGLKLSDTHMMDTLNKAAIPYQLIFTKSDLTKEGALQVALKSAFDIIFSMKNNTCFPYIHVVSTKNGCGLEDLKLFMADVLAQNWGHHDEIEI